MFTDERILRMGRWAILSLALIGFVIYPNALYPDVFTKGLFVRIAITVAALAWLWLVLRKALPSPRMTPLAWAVLLFIGALLVSMVVSPSIYRSFWGEAQRMEGVFGMLHYAALFFAARALFREKDWGRYFNILLKTVPFLVGYAILQYVSARGQVELPFVYSPSLQPGSLFGNPAFFSVFLIFAIGFGLLRYREEQDRVARNFIAFTIALSASAIVWLGVRGEVFGMVGMFAAYRGISAFWGGTKKQRTAFVVAIVACIVAGGSIVALRHSLWDYYPPLIQRIVNLPNEPTFATRWLSLEASSRAFLDSPKTIAFGWGQEHFLAAYGKYYNPKHGLYEDVWFDRAHNKLADVLVTGGLLGMLAYLTLFAVAGWYLWRIAKSGAHRAAVLGGSALLAGYFMQNLAFFDLPHSYANFFLLLALLDTLRYPQGEIPAGKESKSAARSALFGVIALGAAALVAYSAIIPLVQSHRYVTYLLVTHDGNDMVKNWNTIFEPRNFAHYTLVDDFWRRMQVNGVMRDPQFAPVVEKLIGELVRITEREPSDAAMWLRLGTAYTERAVGGNSKDDYAKGEAALRRALELSKTREEISYELAFNLQGQGRKEEALRMAREIMEREPEIFKARFMYGLNLALAGDLGGAVREIEEVRKAGWFPNMQAVNAKNAITTYAAYGSADLTMGLIADVLTRKIVNDQEYFVMLIRHFIGKQDADAVLLWAERYRGAYPEFADDMYTVSDLVKKGSWDMLKQL